MIKYFLYACLLATFLSICVECDKLESKKKEEAKYVKGHLQPLGESGDIFPIEVHSGFIKPELFYHEYVQKAIPVVFKGAAVDIPAYKLWTDEYIRSVTPNDTRGNVVVETTLKEEQPHINKTMHLTEFLNHYKNETYYTVHDLGDFLKKDLVLPWSIQCPDYESILKSTVMWFSNGGTKSKFHVDTFENINCLFRGKKNFLLVDTHKYWHSEKNILDNAAYSNVDADAVDLEKYAALRGIEFRMADIEAGDCIYIPQFLLHYVKSFENNLAVNLWWQGSQLIPIDTSKCSTSFDLSKTLDKYRITIFPLLYGVVDEDPHLGMIAEMIRLKFVHQFVGPPRKTFSYSQREFVTKLLSIYGDHENFNESFNLLFERIDTNQDGRFTELDRLGEKTGAANATWVKFSESFDVMARRYGVNFFLCEPLVELPVADSDVIQIFQASLNNVRMKYESIRDEF